jgi:hypothetical protein
MYSIIRNAVEYLYLPDYEVGKDVALYSLE